MPYKDIDVRRRKAREQSKAWYEAHLEYARARRREYNKSDVGKACNAAYKKTDNGKLICRAKEAKRRSMTGQHNQTDLKLIHEIQNERCFYCDVDLPLRGSQADHFDPVALGGASYRYNIVIACVSCNSKKRAQHPAVFMNEMGRFPALWNERGGDMESAPSNPARAIWDFSIGCNVVLQGDAS